MKKIYFVLFCLAFAFLSGCSSERHVNARSVKSAFKSVRTMKEYLPKDQKLEFQIAFWTIRNAYQNDEEFLDAINRKTASEIIEIGKEKFEDMRSNGHQDYQKYSGWQDMIEKDKAIREQQDLGIAKENQRNQRDRTNNVLYDLR